MWTVSKMKINYLYCVDSLSIAEFMSKIIASGIEIISSEIPSEVTVQ
jgi:hypothetical protein